MERMFAEVIFHARESRGLTQDQLGTLMNVPQTSISAFEGAARAVGEDAIERVAAALETTVFELFAEYVDARRACTLKRRGASVGGELLKEALEPAGPQRVEQLRRVHLACRGDKAAMARVLGVSRQAVGKALAKLPALVA